MCLGPFFKWQSHNMLTSNDKWKLPAYLVSFSAWMSLFQSCFFQHVMNLFLFQLYGTGEVVRSDPIRMQPSVCPDPPQISVTVVGLEERRQLEKLTCDLANKRDRWVFVFWPSYMVSLVCLYVCVCMCMVVCVQWCVTVKYSSLCSLCLQLSVSVIHCLVCVGV